jgi:uncharacterized protein (TIGR02444 family)
MAIDDFPSFAEALYARAGVEQACLDLQDRRGLDVPVLLHACWLGARARVLRAAESSAVVWKTMAWRNEVVRPLRRVRRRLKAGVENMPRELSEPVRKQVKAAELAAERALLALLAGVPDGGGGSSGIAGNLAACLAAANLVVNDEDRDSLAVLEREALALAGKP